jgi:hypothetical protein
MSLQLENEVLPDFRRQAQHTAFIEGWGLYCSLLAAEMGLYADPYDEYGMLSMDAFLTSRLVVDTGMNALGWSRARAAEFMKETRSSPTSRIRTETLRYSTDIPGQALAYKVGARTILRLREKARSALGPRFDDIRAFHDAVLAAAPLPLFRPRGARRLVHIAAGWPRPARPRFIPRRSDDTHEAGTDAGRRRPRRERRWPGHTHRSRRSSQAPPTAPRALFAITGGTVVVGGGRVLPGATVVVRDGVIEAVGKGVRIPAGAHDRRRQGPVRVPRSHRRPGRAAGGTGQADATPPSASCPFTRR